ncbi:Uncharacterised protein [Bordetella pertussis]|nr:Uncharacterised protein [Bordetella pertussis]
MVVHGAPEANGPLNLDAVDAGRTTTSTTAGTSNRCGGCVR